MSKPEERICEFYALCDPRYPGKWKSGDYEYENLPRYFGIGFEGRRFEHFKETIKTCGGNTHKHYWIQQVLRETGRYPIVIQVHTGTRNECASSEIFSIWATGRADLGLGPLTNKTDGGEGSHGYIPTEETKNKISEKIKILWGDPVWKERQIKLIYESINTDEYREKQRKITKKRFEENPESILRGLEIARNNLKDPIKYDLWVERIKSSWTPDRRKEKGDFMRQLFIDQPELLQKFCDGSAEMMKDQERKDEWKNKHKIGIDEYWNNEEVVIKRKKQMSETTSERMNDPEIKKESSKKMNVLWNDPEWAKNNIEAIRKGIPARDERNRNKSVEVKQQEHDIKSKIVKDRWADPEYQDKMNNLRSTPEYKQMMDDKCYKNPEWLEKNKAAQNTPEMKKLRSEQSKERWKDPEFHAARCEEQKGKNNPMYGRDRSGKNNPMYKRKQSEETKQKIRKKALLRAAKKREEANVCP